MVDVALPRPRRVHYGWVITGASLVIGVTAYGVYYSFALFYPAMVAEFGWSRGATSGALSLGLIMYGLFAMPMGWLVDRIGPRRTLVASGVLFGLGTYLGSHITALWHVYALYGLVTAIGMGAAWGPLVATISRWFARRRGLAVALGSLGGGTGALFVTPLVSYLIDAYGWRQAYAVTGVLSGALITGAAMFMWRDPVAKDGGLPFGAGSPTESGAAGYRPDQGVTTAEAVRSPVFWRMVMTFGLWWCGGALVWVQLAPYVQEKGFSRATAALVVACFGAGNGAGKIGMGMAGDRVGPRRVFAAATVLAAVVMAAIVPTGSAPLLVVLGFLFGVTYGGGSPQITPIVAALFGLRSLGTLIGVVMALMGAIGAAGPLLGGVVFDLTGSYAIAYMVGAALLVCAATLTRGLAPPDDGAARTTGVPMT